MAFGRLVVVMNTRMLRHVRQMWNVPFVPESINRANRLKWVRSVRLLGDKWLIVKHVERLKDANQS